MPGVKTEFQTAAYLAAGALVSTAAGAAFVSGVVSGLVP
jgi:hypothetical protein